MKLVKKTPFLLLLGLALVTTNCKKKGCTDETATNYDEKAKKDDGSCEYAEPTLYTYYLDLDGDGLGDPNTTITSEESTPPTGYTDNGDDKVDAVPSTTPVPFVTKFTGETCYYCGEWGWQAWIDLADSFQGTGLSFALYGTGFSDGTFRGEELNKTTQKLQNMFYNGGGKPSFGANGVDYAQNSNGAKNNANKFITNTTVPVGITFAHSIDGSTLTIDAEAHFFEDLTGEYYLAAYVIENNARGPQAGPNGGSNVEHHYVMRGSMDSPWGQQLDAATGVQAKSFSVEIPSNYVKENLTYGLVVWERNGTDYTFVNAASNQ